MAKQKNSETTSNHMISVIIPMYNAEKYIGACLQSLVDQTYQDFDIIIINDCSTDNSVAEAEKFKTHFKGRLKIKSLPKNTGASAIPKNTAVQMSRSKYVTFLDSDDYISKTALEELVKVAEETDAEIIHSSRFFSFNDGEEKITVGTFQTTCHVDKPVLETFDIGERIKKFTERGFLWWGCNKLILREFLIKNKIQFPPIGVWEDLVFVFQCVIFAKNYVRVPNVFYYYRKREDSLSHIPKDPFDIVNTLVRVSGYLDEVMGRVEFFQKNPYWRFTFLDWHIQERMNVISKALYGDIKLQPFQVNAYFRKKFEKTFPESHMAFISYFFSVSAFQRFYIAQMISEKNQLQQKVSELETTLAKSKVNSFLK